MTYTEAIKIIRETKDSPDPSISHREHAFATALWGMMEKSLIWNNAIATELYTRSVTDTVWDFFEKPKGEGPEV